jgi:hypothetical protein
VTEAAPMQTAALSNAFPIVLRDMFDLVDVL